MQAPEVLRILKQKPLSVAPGVVEAATAHIRTVTARIRLVNQQLRAAHRLSGVAPVTRRSSKSCIVVRRYACNKRLENALYHWARVAIQHDELSRNRYAALRGRGHGHGRALRTVADRLLSVAYTLLDQQTLFDPDYKARAAVAA